MTTEYKLSYTATEIDERLGKIDNLVASVNGITPDENGNVNISVTAPDGSIVVDPTLSQGGVAADAKAVGDALHPNENGGKLLADLIAHHLIARFGGKEFYDLSAT